jgi:hypothetical protein
LGTLHVHSSLHVHGSKTFVVFTKVGRKSTEAPLDFQAPNFLLFSCYYYILFVILTNYKEHLTIYFVNFKTQNQQNEFVYLLWMVQKFFECKIANERTFHNVEHYLAFGAKTFEFVKEFLYGSIKFTARFWNVSIVSQLKCFVLILILYYNKTFFSQESFWNSFLWTSFCATSLFSKFCVKVTTRFFECNLVSNFQQSSSSTSPWSACHDARHET